MLFRSEKKAKFHVENMNEFYSRRIKKSTQKKKQYLQNSNRFDQIYKSVNRLFKEERY